jgi:hypothetical protein
MKRAIVCLLLAGCGSGSNAVDGGGFPPADLFGVTCEVPSETNALYAFLSAQMYKSFAKQPAIHPASGPHARFTQVYANAALAGEPSGATVHPVCSALIKEFYSSQTATQPFGWAVSVKTQPTSTNAARGDGWFWYENAHGSTNGATGVQGEPDCVGCHSGPADDHVAAVDFVKSPLPLQ